MTKAPLPPPADLTELEFDDSFVRSLPSDPREDAGIRQVTKACYSFVQPTPVHQPKLLAWSDDLAQQLGIVRPVASSPAVEVLAGNRLLPGMRPYAARYGGHQFGQWAGQLGDGRAITLGEMRPQPGQRFEIQLKGAGPTPYSRRADGRAVLRSSIREFLCSEAMHHLGVPTTRALSLVATSDQVVRDMFYDGRPQLEDCAIVARVAPSFVRFGNFQILAAHDERAELRRLADYVIAQHYPELLADSVDVYGRWFHEICRRTAHMIAAWQGVGFVHGVMNTDNMSILGLTIDYGPYGWLDVYDPNWTPNTTDAGRGRYRFAHQAPVALWNLAQLGQALQSLLESPDAIETGLSEFRSSYFQHYRRTMADKLGLQEINGQDDLNLLKELDAVLQLTPHDMTIFYRRLAAFDPTDTGLTPADGLAILRPAYYEAQLDPAVRERILAWLQTYTERSRLHASSASARVATMQRANPKYILRNYLAQQAIEAAESGDSSGIERLLQAVQKPYDEQPAFEDLAAPRPAWARNKAGCSALSCSS